MTTLSLLTAAQAALIAALAAAVNMLVAYLKPLVESVLPDDSAQHDALIRLLVLLLAEGVTFAAAAAQGIISPTSWFGLALGGGLVAAGAIAGFHLTHDGSAPASGASGASVDPQALIDQAIQQLVPTGGIVPPSSAFQEIPVPAPAPAPASPASAPVSPAVQQSVSADNAVTAAAVAQ